MKRVLVSALFAGSFAVTGCVTTQPVTVDEDHAEEGRVLVDAAPNPDLRSCGLVWDHDDGNISVWRATRPASVGVGEYNSNGQWSEARINMNRGDFVRIRMGSQTARCL